MQPPIVPTHLTSRHAWSAACLLLFCALTLLLHATRGWYLLGVPSVSPDRAPFSDAYAQLATADACLLGAGTWVEHVCFIPSADVLPHAQTYEPWLLFSRLGFTHDHYTAISGIMIVLFYLGVCLLFKPAAPRQALLLALIVLSSAVQLAVERANFDLAMATLLMASGWLLARRSLFASVFACGLLGFGTTLKIYTGLSALFAWLASNSRGRVPVVCASIVACVLAVAVLGIDNILVLGTNAPEGTSRFSTGAHLTFRHYGFAAAALIAVASILACAALLRTGFRTLPRRLFAHEYTTEIAVFIVSWLTAVPLFFLKDSYDYRLVLWLPMLALAARLARDVELPAALRRAGKAIVIAFISVAWIELACEVAERLLTADSFQIAEKLLVLVKHAAMWSLVWLSSALLALILWARESLRP